MRIGLASVALVGQIVLTCSWATFPVATAVLAAEALGFVLNLIRRALTWNTALLIFDVYTSEHRRWNRPANPLEAVSQGEVLYRSVPYLGLIALTRDGALSTVALLVTWSLYVVTDRLMRLRALESPPPRGALSSGALCSLVLALGSVVVAARILLLPNWSVLPPLWPHQIAVVMAYVAGVQFLEILLQAVCSRVSADATLERALMARALAPHV